MKTKEIIDWIAEKIFAGISVLLVGSVIMAFLFFSIKGCIVTTWSPPNELIIYEGYSDNLDFVSLKFYPDHDMIISYESIIDSTEESALFKTYGNYGTHYFGIIWNMNEQGILFGFRIFPTGLKPVVMHSKLVRKITGGLSKSNFPKEGRSITSLFLISNDSLRFQHTWLYSVPNNKILNDSLLLMHKY